MDYILTMSFYITSTDDCIILEFSKGMDFWEIMEGIPKLCSMPEFNDKSDIWVFRDGQLIILYSDLYDLKNAAEKFYPKVSKGKKTADSDIVNVTIKEAGNIPFDVEPGKLLLLSDRIHNPSSSFRIDKKARKLHFLVVAFVNNKDVFSEVGEIIVRCAKPKGEHAVAPPEPHLIQKTLYYPGNVDNWFAKGRSHDYESYGKGWSTSPAISTAEATFSIITIDLGKEEFVESITVKSLGRMPAIGIAGISSEL